MIVCDLFTRETNQFDDSANTTAADDKLEPEGLDKATPLKVFRTPNRVVRTRRASGASIAKLDQDAETGRLIPFIGCCIRRTKFHLYFLFFFCR